MQYFDLLNSNPELVLTVLSFLTDWEDRENFSIIDKKTFEITSQAIEYIPKVTIDINHSQKISYIQELAVTDLIINDYLCNKFDLSKYETVISKFQSISSLNLSSKYNKRSIRRLVNFLRLMNKDISLRVNPHLLRKWKYALFHIDAKKITLNHGNVEVEEYDISSSEDESTSNSILSRKIPKKLQQSSLPLPLVYYKQKVCR